MAGLGECLEALLELGLAVHGRCAASTAALLDMLETGMRLSGSPEWDSRLLHHAPDQAHWLKAHTYGLLSKEVGLKASPATVVGTGDGQEAKDHCAAAAFGPWLAESLKCFHEWMDTKMDKQLHAKVRQLHTSAFTIVLPSSNPLLSTCTVVGWTMLAKAHGGGLRDMESQYRLRIDCRSRCSRMLWWLSCRQPSVEGS